MKKFYLIGLGLNPPKSISLQAIEIMKKTKKIFLENYTNYVKTGTKNKIEKLINKKILSISREELEDQNIILENLKKEDVVLLVLGDPLIATTHGALVLAAKKIAKVEILSNQSILNYAIALSGLQAYKFGKICTITYWRENYRPTSFLEVIKNNMQIQAHSLCLLDLDKNFGPMNIKKALEIIFRAQEEEQKKIIFPNTKIIILSKIGFKNQKIWAGEISQLKKDISGPSVIIIPSKMHFLEEEYFEQLKKESN
ncbi:MAG: diphthine synthase [Candidatus Omnitrophica bacterium]|nr:diphthine synthase [Candidatus Omnitrophota bacterium]